ncbi:hypothetical protein V7O66_01390 [Methanolobus sp. ZRKC3]|uniref:hypothetical protein n=1 Tax=Methanolobus sp. ZRKC3 TaxID=3125786 RepID=UPI003255A786
MMNDDIIEIDKKATRLGYELMGLEDELDIIIEGIGHAISEVEKTELLDKKDRIEREIADIKDERFKLNQRLFDSF